jgi:hypothetical protein
MKYVNDLVERSQINRNCRRIDAAASQARDLGRNRMGCGGKISGGRFVAKPSRHPAPECPKSYLNGIM